jgi:hypothetical protein
MTSRFFAEGKADSGTEIQKSSHHGGLYMGEEKLGKRNVDGVKGGSQKGKQCGTMLGVHGGPPKQTKPISPQGGIL